jgi:MFS family permease
MLRGSADRRGRVARPVHGWWVVVGGSVLLTLQNGLIISAFGAYLVSITADTGWDAGLIAIGYAVVQLGNGFLAPLTGWCCDRFGTRAVARIGTLTTAAGFAVAAGADSGGHFVGAVVVVALGCSAAGITPLTIAVVQSMSERRTLALGLLPTGVALGGLFVPLVVWTLGALGWRTTFLVIAAITGGVGLVAGHALPAGDGGGFRRSRRPAPIPADEMAAGVPTAPAADGHDLGAALRTSAFWLLVVGHGSALIAVSAVNLHLVPLINQLHGYSLGAAGLAVAAMSLAQLLGQVVTGMVADRFDKRRLAAGCMIVQALVLVAFALVSSLPLLVLAAVVHGVTWGLRGPVMTSLRTEYFGLGSFGTIMGWSMGFVSIGLVAGPILVTVIAAGPGGYPVAFVTLAAIIGVGCVAFLVVRPPLLRAPGRVRVPDVLTTCCAKGEGAPEAG